MTRAAAKGALLQGTLDMLILRTLQVGPAHGHDISKHIRQTSNQVLQVEHGSLYPALHRLERKRLVTGKWELHKQRNREFKYLPPHSGRAQTLGGGRIPLEDVGRRHRARDGANHRRGAVT